VTHDPAHRHRRLFRRRRGALLPHHLHGGCAALRPARPSGSVDAHASKVGADFLVCPDNTIHQALPYIEGRSPLPWLHIAEVVASEAADRRFRKLALTGTKYLVESDVYPQKLAAREIAYVRPEPAEREEINRIIFDELVYGVLKPEQVASFQRVIGRLKAEGCDAVVLGCTEIPLIMNDTNSPLPTLDSTRLLARAALKRAVS
jgi:aspartate racemase